MGLNIPTGQQADKSAEQKAGEEAAKQNAEQTQTVASGEAAAGLEKAIESADTANPLTPTIDGNDSANNAGGQVAAARAVVEAENLNGDKVITEVFDGDVGPKTIATFSSSPVSNYAVGEHQFENGILTFNEGDEEALADFERIIDSKNFPAYERSKIVKIDVAAAERLLEDARRANGGTTQAIDSTVGERVNKPKAEGNLGTTANRGN